MVMEVRTWLEMGVRAWIGRGEVLDKGGWGGGGGGGKENLTWCDYFFIEVSS